MLKIYRSVLQVGTVKVIIGKERERREMEIEVRKGEKVEDVMKKLGLVIDEFVPIVNGEVVTELEELREGDTLEFVRVWSGG